MPTLADFQEEQPGFVPDQDVQPDMVKHDPNTFAGLVGQNALKKLYWQGLSPTGDDIKAIEAEALKSATDYHKTLAIQQEQANVEEQKKLSELQPIPQLGGESLVSAQAREQARVAQEKEEAQEQFRQGPSAVAAAAQNVKAGQPGLVKALPDADMAKLDSYAGAYQSVSNLHSLFQNAVQKAPGVGGFWRGTIGGLVTQPNLTSPESRAYNAYLEGSISPIARGVLGDVPVSATKENIMERLGNNVLPVLGGPGADNDQSGGQKAFLLKQRLMQSMQDMRDDRANNGFDPTPIDRLIGKFNSDFMSPTTQKYNPMAGGGQPLVQTGTSPQANATTAVTNAGANAGIPIRPMQQAGTSGSTLAPGAAPTQPGPQPQAAAPQAESFWGSGSD